MRNLILCKNIGLVTTYIIIALGLLYICSKFGSKAYFTLSFYGVLLLLYIIIKKAIAYSYKRKCHNIDNYTVSAIIFVKNESLETLVLTIKSLLNQDYPLKELFIIDIVSKNLDIYRLVTKIKKQIELYEESRIKGEIDLGDLKCFPDIIFKKIERVEEKEAEVWGFRRCTGDVIVTCRSNDLIGKEEVKNLVNVFYDSNISTITGNIKIVSSEKCKLINWVLLRNEDVIPQNLRIQPHISNVFCYDTILMYYRREDILKNINSYNNNFIERISKYKTKVTFWTICEMILSYTFFICFFVLMWHNFFWTILLLINYYIVDVLILINSNNANKLNRELVEILKSPIYSLMYYIFAIPFKIYNYFLFKRVY